MNNKGIMMKYGRAESALNSQYPDWKKPIKIINYLEKCVRLDRRKIIAQWVPANLYSSILCESTIDK